MKQKLNNEAFKATRRGINLLLVERFGSNSQESLYNFLFSMTNKSSLDKLSEQEMIEMNEYLREEGYLP